MQRSHAPFALAACLPLMAAAAGYPQQDKPIHFIVGFSAGSTIDNVSRVVVDDIRAHRRADHRGKQTRRAGGAGRGHRGARPPTATP